MSHLGPSLSHLYGGCKAPKQVGKSLKLPALCQELWPALSLKPSFPCFWTKSYWTYNVHSFCFRQVMCVKSCEPRASAHSENIYCTAEDFSACRALPCVEHLRVGDWSFYQTFCACACFKTVRGNIVRSKVCCSNGTAQEPLNPYLFCFL